MLPRQLSAPTPSSVPLPAVQPLVVDMDRFLVVDTAQAGAMLDELEARCAIMSRALSGEATEISLEEFAAFVRTGLDVSSLPIDPDLEAYLRDCHEEGCKLHLISSASQPIVDAVASRLGIFETADGGLPGRALDAAGKFSLIKDRFPDGFAFAGRSLGGATIYGEPPPPPRSGSKPATEADAVSSSPMRDWIRALRCHQWSKNALVFVPLVLGHAYGDPVAVLTTVAGFLLVSLLASGTYIVNDLLDLDADRKHPTKRNRPLARGAISPQSAKLVAGVLIAGSLIGAAFVSLPFLAVLAGYLALTIAYSVWLKRVLLVDVFVLAVLFTARIGMGIALAGVEPSNWLLTFTMFFFLSLSLAKRHVEVVSADALGIDDLPGRDYRASDLPLTVSLGMAANAVAMLVMFLYLANDAMPAGYYAQPAWLWIAAFVVFLWSLRVWALSHRGRLDADPVAFAITDTTSLILGAVVVVAFGLAI